MAAVIICSDFGAPQNKVSHCFPIYLPWSDGTTRQELWSGLPFPSSMHESEKWKWSRSVMSDSSDHMDCSLPGSSAHGIFQARVLEWGAITFSISRTSTSEIKWSNSMDSEQSCPNPNFKENIFIFSMKLNAGYCLFQIFYDYSTKGNIFLLPILQVLLKILI